MTNTRSEALKRPGVYYDDVKNRYPGLMYALILGYGEQVIANNFVEKVTYKNSDAIMMLTCPFIMDSVGKVETKIAPRIGGDTEEVLKNLGCTQAQIDAMAEAGAVRVYK